MANKRQGVLFEEEKEEKQKEEIALHEKSGKNGQKRLKAKKNNDNYKLK